jgi:hypothetical protein
MLKNVYILYIDTPKSKQYLDDCIESCKQYEDINVIPVQGYTDLTYTKLCELYNLKPHKWRLNKDFEDFPGCFDSISSVDASHYKIWQMIIDSGEPGVILEHKAIVKAPIKDIVINDLEIVHFGPRILFQDDYIYPEGVEPQRVATEQWEGVHAYGITPKTAQYFFDYLKKYGCIDSTDPMLAFRNTYDLNMYTLDPPPIVVSNGARESTYTATGVSAFWNTLHTPQYLANVKPGAQIASIRKITVSDRSFDDYKDWILETITNLGIQSDQKLDILVLNGNEGYEALKLGNHLLMHDDSKMHVLTQTRLAQLCQFNLYFCWNYTKVSTIPIDNYYDMLYTTSMDDDVQFNIILINNKQFTPDTLSNYVLSWNLLTKGGIMIIKKTDNTDKFIRCIDEKHIVACNNDLIIFCK